MDAKTAPLCNDTAGTLDSHYGLGHGMRGGIEREYVGDPICIGGGQTINEVGTLVRGLSKMVGRTQDSAMVGQKYGDKEK